MLADWLSQQVMGLLTQLLVAIDALKRNVFIDLNIGRVSAYKEECL